ncbi:uncharacterized protein LOC115955867 isoform X2 [Quercus lobata]|uniref:uncharacterized protein LOC115955867 isoform X2 n=1 Tax=Quercus lobata TaxID=97700 RepID=UPI0012458F29|nr:uncharacterized protein LOC115955867 isoform X2 [Quercus lobata]
METNSSLLQRMVKLINLQKPRPKDRFDSRTNAMNDGGNDATLIVFSRDVSYNNIQGEIPYSLPPNATNINMAYNYLRQNIPHSLPAMKCL